MYPVWENMVNAPLPLWHVITKKQKFNTFVFLSLLIDAKWDSFYNINYYDTNLVWSSNIMLGFSEEEKSKHWHAIKDPNSETEEINQSLNITPKN